MRLYALNDIKENLPCMAVFKDKSGTRELSMPPAAETAAWSSALPPVSMEPEFTMPFCRSNYVSRPAVRRKDGNDYLLSVRCVFSKMDTS